MGKSTRHKQVKAWVVLFDMTITVQLQHFSEARNSITSLDILKEQDCRRQMVYTSGKEDFYPSSKIRFNKRLTIYLSYSYIPMPPFQNLDTLTSFGAR